MKKTILIALSLLVASMGFAQKPQTKNKNRAYQNTKGQHARFGYMRGSLLKDIGVEDATIEKIKTLMQDMRKETLSIQKEIKEKHLALRKELLEKTLNEGKIKTLINEQGELRKKQLVVAEIKKLEFYKLLTSEQREKLFKGLEKERKNFLKKSKAQKNKKRAFHKRGSKNNKRKSFYKNKKNRSKAFYKK